MKKFAIVFAMFVAPISQASARIVDKYANLAASSVIGQTKNREDCMPAAKTTKTMVKGVEVYWMQFPSCNTYFTATQVQGVGVVAIHSDAAADRKEAEKILLESVEFFNNARKISR